MPGNDNPYINIDKAYGDPNRSNIYFSESTALLCYAQLVNAGLFYVPLLKAYTTMKIDHFSSGGSCLEPLNNLCAEAGRNLGAKNVGLPERAMDASQRFSQIATSYLLTIAQIMGTDTENALRILSENYDPGIPAERLSWSDIFSDNDDLLDWVLDGLAAGLGIAAIVAATVATLGTATAPALGLALLGAGFLVEGGALLKDWAVDHNIDGGDFATQLALLGLMTAIGVKVGFDDIARLGGELSGELTKVYKGRAAIEFFSMLKGDTIVGIVAGENYSSAIEDGLLGGDFQNAFLFLQENGYTPQQAQDILKEFILQQDASLKISEDYWIAIDYERYSPPPPTPDPNDAPGSGTYGGSYNDEYRIPEDGAGQDITTYGAPRGG